MGLNSFKKFLVIRYLTLICLAPHGFAHGSIPNAIPLPNRASGPTAGPHSAVELPAKISCGHAFSIARWAHAKFGGPKPAQFQSARFGAKVAQSLATRWDPYRVLQTRQQVAQLEQVFKRHWAEFSRSRSCTALAKAIDLHLAQMNQNLDKNAATLSPKDVLPKALLAQEKHSDPDLRKYDQFADKPTALQTRLQVGVKTSLQHLSQPWFNAFDKDGKKLIRSIVHSRFTPDTEKESTHWLLQGALAALDPYSTYLTNDEFEDLTQDLSGVASGIGIRVRNIPAGLMIREVLEKSPAGKSGKIVAGDYIVEIDGNKIAGLNDRQKQNALRGAAGQAMNLRIVKKSGGEAVVKVVREEINLEDTKVSYRFYPLRQGEGDVAILKIPSFYAESGWNLHGENKSCALDVEKAVTEIISRRQKISAIVLDMRGNPGGFLEEAVNMAGLFMGNQPVVGVAQGDNVKILRNYHRKPLYSGPLIALLDSDSASASEVLAGALRDSGRAVVIAEGNSYGKGSVQRLFPLRDILDSELYLSTKQKTGAVKLTTSLFFSPNGVSPEGSGVEAHIRIGKDKKDHSGTYRLAKVKQAALQNTDLVDLGLTPFLTADFLKTLEAKSRVREPSIRENLEVSLNKALKDDSDMEVSPGLVEAVAVARDFGAANVAVKN